MTKVIENPGRLLTEHCQHLVQMLTFHDPVSVTSGEDQVVLLQSHLGPVEVRVKIHREPIKPPPPTYLTLDQPEEPHDDE